MLSSSTPDLRDGSYTPSVSVTSLMDRFGLIAPSTDKSSEAGTVKDTVPRPGSAPATKHRESDSVFEESVDMVDPTGDFGDIFSVLSIDDDPKQPDQEADQTTTHGADDILKKHQIKIDEDLRNHNSKIDNRNQPQMFNKNLRVFRSITPAIIEMSGEDSDSFQSKPRAKSPFGTIGSCRSKPQAQQSSRDKTSLDFKPQVNNLRAPTICVVTSDDTSSDSSDEAVPFILPAARRNSGAFRRRHSLAATTPDQITRTLLSHRRGSSSGLPIPCAECFQTMNFESSCLARKPVEKQKSADGENHSRPPNRSLSIQQTTQSHRGPTGRRASLNFSRPRSPSRVVTPSSSMYLRPVSPEPLSTTVSEIIAPRPVSPRVVSPLSPGPLSPRSQSPIARSPGLMRQTPLSLRDEIQMILSTPPTTPPRSQSISPRSFSSRPKQGRPGGTGRSSRRSSNGDTGEPESARTDSQKTSSSLGPFLGVQGNKPSRTRSGLAAPRSLKLEPGDSRPSSPRADRARSPRPAGHDRRSTRRRYSLADIAAKTAEFSSLMSGGSSSRRSSGSLCVPDESDDDGSADSERVVMDRRRRRGSRGKTCPTGDHQKLAVPTICIPLPTQQDEFAGPGPAEKAAILAKLGKKRGRRSTWAPTGEPLISMTQLTALTLLRRGSSDAQEKTEQTKDPYALTLHFITDPGQSHPLRKILRPLIKSVVPKIKLFNFVERSESAAHEQRESSGGADHRDKPTASVPTLGVVLLLQEDFGMERILDAQKYLGTEPWELHHRGKVGSNNVPYPTNNQDFYAHPGQPGAALWAVRQVHFGKDRLRFQLFVSDEMWTDSMKFYSLLLSRSTHVEKADFCYFLVFCSHTLNLEVQLALKKLPPGFKPQFLDSTILQFKVEDMDKLAPLLPRVYVPISGKRWQTADPDGNKVLLFKEGDSSDAAVTPTPPDSPPDTPGNGEPATVMAPSCDTERQSQTTEDYEGHLEESNLVSAV